MFQLVTRVAGRTGRGDKGGLALVQTFSPDYVAIQTAARHDFAAFAQQETGSGLVFRSSPWTTCAFQVQPLTRLLAYVSSAKGQLRRCKPRKTFNSTSVCGWLTHASHRRGSAGSRLCSKNES